MGRKSQAYCPIRQGDVVDQVSNSFVAQSVDLSLWHEVQAFGILYLTVIAGVTNLNVWELTKDPGTPSVASLGI